MSKPAIVAVDMGYGHLRAALPVAEALGTSVLELDRPPLAGPEEQRDWARVRALHAATSRLASLPWVGQGFRALMDAATHIDPLHPRRDMSAKTATTRYLERRAAEGLGRGLLEYLRAHDAPLFTTFYAPAVLADHLGWDRVYCLATDSDLHRVWAPIDVKRSRTTYFAPAPRAKERLLAYGVRPERVISAGFPLPEVLLGGRELGALRRNLARRLARLDPSGAFLQRNQRPVEAALGSTIGPADGPRTLVFAVGGAGAQSELPRAFLPSLAPGIRDGRWRVVLVAGRRLEVKERLDALVAQAGLGEPGVEVLYRPDFGDYYRAFNEKLAEADVLWTKPSEMTFYAALGLPLIFSPPVGAHEVKNRRWAIECGAGLLERAPEAALDWLEELAWDGTLAGAAFSGMSRFPADGLYAIVDRITGSG